MLKASKLPLKLSLPVKQMLITSDANDHAAGYVLLIQDYTDEEVGETSKFAPEAFGSKTFTTRQVSLTMYARELLAMHLTFDGFGHIIWGTKKSVILMNGNRTLTRFFQAKHIPPHFGILVINCCNIFFVSSCSRC